MTDYLSNLKFANDGWALIVPVVLMAIDIITGTVNAWIKGEIKSGTMRQGLGKKFGEIAIIAVGQVFFFGVGMPEWIVDGISIYIALMEIISILENAEKLGVPVPAFVLKAIKQTSDKIARKNDTEGGSEKNDKESKDA